MIYRYVLERREDGGWREQDHEYETIGEARDDMSEGYRWRIIERTYVFDDSELVEEHDYRTEEEEDV